MRNFMAVLLVGVSITLSIPHHAAAGLFATQILKKHSRSESHYLSSRQYKRLAPKVFTTDVKIKTPNVFYAFLDLSNGIVDAPIPPSPEIIQAATLKQLNNQAAIYGLPEEYNIVAVPPPPIPSLFGLKRKGNSDYPLFLRGAPFLFYGPPPLTTQKSSAVDDIDIRSEPPTELVPKPEGEGNYYTSKWQPLKIQRTYGPPQDKLPKFKVNVGTKNNMPIGQGELIAPIKPSIKEAEEIYGLPALSEHPGFHSILSSFKEEQRKPEGQGELSVIAPPSEKEPEFEALPALSMQEVKLPEGQGELQVSMPLKPYSDTKNVYGLPEEIKTPTFDAVLDVIKKEENSPIGEGKLFIDVSRTPAIEAISEVEVTEIPKLPLLEAVVSPVIEEVKSPEVDSALLVSAPAQPKLEALVNVYGPPTEAAPIVYSSPATVYGPPDSVYGPPRSF